jgi:hypothetical protein
LSSTSTPASTHFWVLGVDMPIAYVPAAPTAAYAKYWTELLPTCPSYRPSSVADSRYARPVGSRDCSSVIHQVTTELAATVVIFADGAVLTPVRVELTAGVTANCAEPQRSTTMLCCDDADGVDETVMLPGEPDTVAVHTPAQPLNPPGAATTRWVYV